MPPTKRSQDKASAFGAGASRLRAWTGLFGMALVVALSPALTTEASAATPPPPMPVPATDTLPQRIEFNRHVRPILSENCFKCHGPDKSAREAELRLDDKQSATKDRDGHAAIVPGKSGKSELVRRILSNDDEERMPPPKSGKRPLTARQIALLKKWIDAGAEYQPHWSLIPPKRPPLPEVKEKQWPRGSIDYFVLARLESEGLRPSPRADRRTLIRRVTLDLTGLPPTPAEIDAFLSDTSPGAYEKVVDRLLASPRYAEQMARHWLDAARYGDTNGYQYDMERTQWPWRDWVIDAFNRNMPFDRFTIEQLAGDLLPGSTPEQRLATGFNRNHGITVEGGVIDEEYRTEYVMDRVTTTSTVWLGLTMGCARCHDHKFDPISRKELYQFFAFFNQVDETGFKGFDPQLKVLSPLQQRELAKIDRQLAVCRRALAAVQAGATADTRHLGDELSALKRRREQIEKELVPTLVMRDRAQPRPTFMLERGKYDQHGEKVTAAVPAALPPLPKDAPANRLGLAQWLVDPGHPLTARVTVNRFWQQYFGTGIVKTAGDFGSQGELPSNPDLLDYLATEFVASGWDVKHMQRLIVTSATYRQSSRVDPVLLERDPENRLLARGPRVRLDAEEIRDSALLASGLLVEKLGGPSVYPYQPAGLWTELNDRPGYSTAYKQGTGSSLYRRSMYTFWKRTVPSPPMQILDAPSREVCTVRRSRTNTPLQALVLLYDPQFVEAARHLAARMIREGGPMADERIAYGFQLATARLPAPGEAVLLKRYYSEQRESFRRDKQAAHKLLSIGDSPRDDKLDPLELASLASVARMILNLDETITKE